MVSHAKLPPDLREALLLVGASDFSYEQAAAICETPIGTIKSRVNRARARLSKLRAIDSADTEATRVPPPSMVVFGLMRG
jgi:DNA-directed RNA polymerase specialized sigma24 family protein